MCTNGFCIVQFDKLVTKLHTEEFKKKNPPHLNMKHQIGPCTALQDLITVVNLQVKIIKQIRKNMVTIISKLFLIF